MQPKLILFDLDGVLLDSRENMRRSWDAVRARFPAAPEFDRYFAEIGLPFDEIMRRLRLSEQAGTIEQVFRETSAATLDAAPFFYGVPEMLKALARAGIYFGVVTSKDRERTERVLARLPVRFEFVATPDGRYRGKPAPDHLLRGMAHFGADPSETFYIGDMPVDAEAARRAGCHYAWASWGYGNIGYGVTTRRVLLSRPEDVLSLVRAEAA